MGGMNDQGLCFDITSILESVMKPHPEKLYESNPGVFGEMILKNCKTVEETVEFIELYDLSSFDEFQFLFADRTGDSIVLCPGPDGEMKVIQKEGVYQVITNFNISQRELGNYPCLRYSNASEMLARIKSEDDLTVEYFVEILEIAHQESTTYSMIYDPVHGVIYFYNKHNFDEVVEFNVKDHLEKGYHSYSASSLFSGEGEPFSGEGEPFSGEGEPFSGEGELSEELEESEVPEHIYMILIVVFVILMVVVYKIVKKVKRE